MLQDLNEDPDPQWHLTFQIPELGNFSSFVKEAVKSGIVFSHARCEIIPSSAYLYYSKHCLSNFRAIHHHLSQTYLKYPTLQDTEGKSHIVSNYIIIICLCCFMYTFQGSWKLSLRTSFKNFRRHYDKNDAAEEPLAKRLRLLYTEDEADIGDDEYEEAVKELQEHKAKKLGKKGKGHGHIKRLMEITRVRRYQWIHIEQPLISDILNKFPYLSTHKWVY